MLIFDYNSNLVRVSKYSSSISGVRTGTIGANRNTKLRSRNPDVRGNVRDNEAPIASLITIYRGALLGAEIAIATLLTNISIDTEDSCG